MKVFVARTKKGTQEPLFEASGDSGNSENEDYGPICLVYNLDCTVKHLHGLEKMSYLQIPMVSSIKHFYQNGTVFDETYKSLRVEHDTKSLAFLQKKIITNNDKKLLTNMQIEWLWKFRGFPADV